MRSRRRIGQLAAVLSTVAMVAMPASGSHAAQLRQTPATAPGRGAAPARQVMGAGPNDRPAVDAEAADRGKVTWTADCASCHGADARGTPKGPNMVRSTMVLHDRNGSDIGPFLKKGHPAPSGKIGSNLSDAQVNELAQFLRQRVNDSFRGSPIFAVRNVLTGDRKAGEAFYNGAGKCTTCHSTTGDLAGIGRKYEAVDLQQRMVFPRPPQGRGAAAPTPSRATTTVTVTPESGTPVSGILVEMNDFTVTLRDASGAYQTFNRTPAVKVTKTDPLATHRDMLETLTDKNIHDLVAYLESLK
jgi:mono/diheme cytochrome c family protein